MPPEKLSKNFQVFYLGKMTRLGVLTDAINRGGKVWYTSLVGTALAKQQCAKMIEELSEVIEVDKHWRYLPSSQEYRAKVLEELADVSDTLTQMQETIPLHVYEARQERSGILQVTLETWQRHYEHFQVALNYHSAKPEIGEYMAYTRNSIAKYMRENELEPDELTQAINRKNEAKGPLLHGRTEFIALPKDDEWVDYFTGKFPTVDPDMLNPAAAWKGRPLA